MRDHQTQLNSTSGLPSISVESGKILEAFASPLQYFLKLYETYLVEDERQEITIQPSKGRAVWSRTDIERRVIVKEPTESEFGFQELPVIIS